MKTMNIIVVLPEGFIREHATEDQYKEHSVYETFDKIENDERLKIGEDLYWVWTERTFPGVTYFIADKFEFKEPEYTIEDEITCPYCGLQDSDSWDEADDDDRDCEVCGCSYSYTKVVSVDYRSTPVKKNEEIRVVK